MVLELATVTEGKPIRRGQLDRDYLVLALAVSGLRAALSIDHGWGELYSGWIAYRPDSWVGLAAKVARIGCLDRQVWPRR